MLDLLLWLAILVCMGAVLDEIEKKPSAARAAWKLIVMIAIGTAVLTAGIVSWANKSTIDALTSAKLSSETAKSVVEERLKTCGEKLGERDRNIAKLELRPETCLKPSCAEASGTRWPVTAPPAASRKLVSVTSNNQSGGITAEKVVLGPEDRHLSGDLRAKLSQRIPKGSKVFVLAVDEQEARQLGSEIKDFLISTGHEVMGVGSPMSKGAIFGLHIDPPRVAGDMFTVVVGAQEKRH